MKNIFLFFCLTTSTLFFSQTSKETKIKELIELVGESQNSLIAAEQFINMYKKTYTEIPVEFWNDFLTEAKATDFVKLYTPIYAKFYTEDDITELIKFYKSPIGKKVKETTPLVMEESMQVGQKWGQNLAEKITQKIESQYKKSTSSK